MVYYGEAPTTGAILFHFGPDYYVKIIIGGSGGPIITRRPGMPGQTGVPERKRDKTEKQLIDFQMSRDIICLDS